MSLTIRQGNLYPASIVGNGCFDDLISQEGGPVAFRLGLSDVAQVRRRHSFTSEVAVGVAGKPVAWQIVVDDEHGPTGSAERDCRTRTGESTADDEHVMADGCRWQLGHGVPS